MIRDGDARSHGGASAARDDRARGPRIACHRNRADREAVAVHRFDVRPHRGAPARRELRGGPA